MRREQVHKICLNIFLANDIEFKRKDDQSWTFGANDFSEGEYELTSFAIRFKNKDICDEFKKSIEDALAEKFSESNDNSEIVKKLMLPENFFDFENIQDCSGCLGCKSDEYIYITDRNFELHGEENQLPLPLFSPSNIIRNKSRGASLDKKVSFKIAERKKNDKVAQFFDGNDVQEKCEKSKTDIYGIQKSEATANIFAKFNQDNPPMTSSTTNVFDFNSQNLSGDNKVVFNNTNPSVFSSSLNTGTASSLSIDSKSSDQICIFGSKTNFGNAANGANIFGGGNKDNKLTAFTNTPMFGANIFGSINNTKISESKMTSNIFGSSSTFSFAEAAKELDKSSESKPSTDEPEFLKNLNNIGGFAELAASSNTAFNVQQNNESGQFFGLTVKDDFFSKNLNKQNTSTEGESQNDGENAHDDNYDPHYEPLISLPDEIKVCTGEEDEEKMFGERAKLFRYDISTKEWKERGNYIIYFICDDN